MENVKYSKADISDGKTLRRERRVSAELSLEFGMTVCVCSMYDMYMYSGLEHASETCVVYLHTLNSVECISVARTCINQKLTVINLWGFVFSSFIICCDDTMRMLEIVERNVDFYYSFNSSTALYGRGLWQVCVLIQISFRNLTHFTNSTGRIFVNI